MISQHSDDRKHCRWDSKYSLEEMCPFLRFYNGLEILDDVTEEIARCISKYFKHENNNDCH